MLFSTLILAACAGAPTEVTDASGAQMTLIPAGEFILSTWDDVNNISTDQTLHLDDYYIDQYEVTNQQYRTCVADGACIEPQNTTFFNDPAYGDHPVIFVTWENADIYCEWRSARLPTKAEWDKAAGGELDQTDYYWGDESPVCQVGARLPAGIGDHVSFEPGTEIVGNHIPNNYGIYGMTGSVWEWVQDPPVINTYSSSPTDVSFIRMTRWSGYGPLYGRFLCGIRCAASP
jgi:formylglycine-generating enzyme required for sulfatase activity